MWSLWTQRFSERRLDTSLRAIASLVVLSVLFLGGCATMSRDECLSGNWYDIGYRDGIAGFTADRLANHQRACAEYGVSLEPVLYFQGRESGLQIYCDLNHAVEEGLAGRLYRGVCPPTIDPAYRQLNDVAYSIYDIRNDISRINYRIDSLEREWYRERTSDYRRSEIRRDIHELEREQHWLRHKLYWHEGELDRLSDEYLY